MSALVQRQRCRIDRSTKWGSLVPDKHHERHSIAVDKCRAPRTRQLSPLCRSQFVNGLKRKLPWVGGLAP